MFPAWILCGMEAALEDAPLSGGLSGNSNRNPPKRTDSVHEIYRVVSALVVRRGHPSADLKSTGPRGPWGFESLALRH
jgi:hypothetical protein